MGRTKRKDLLQSRLVEELNRKLDGETKAILLVKAMVTSAIGGDTAMQKYIMDRVEGKPKAEVTLDIFSLVSEIEDKIDVDKYLNKHGVDIPVKEPDKCLSSKIKISDTKMITPASSKISAH